MKLGKKIVILIVVQAIIVGIIGIFIVNRLKDNKKDEEAVKVSTKNKEDKADKSNEKEKAELVEKALDSLNSKFDVKLTIKKEEFQKGEAEGEYRLYAVDEQGKERWTQSWDNLALTELPLASEFTIFEDKVLIDVQGTLYCLDYKSGKILWKAEAVGSCAHAPIVDAEEGTVYVTGYYGPFITAVTLEGKIKWTKDAPSNDIYWPYEVQLQEGKIIVKAEQGRCTYDRDGNLIKTETPGGGSEITENQDPLTNTPAPPTAADLAGVAASSYLVEPSISHVAANICDYSADTAWVESAAGDGIGEYVQLDFNREVSFSTISIINGYAKSNSTYYNNNRVKTIQLVLSDGRSREFELQDNQLDYQNIVLDMPVTTTSVKLIILEVYKGTKYQDTCISELKLVSDTRE
jgi:hypothetical protein